MRRKGTNSSLPSVWGRGWAVLVLRGTAGRLLLDLVSGLASSLRSGLGSAAARKRSREYYWLQLPPLWYNVDLSTEIRPHALLTYSVLIRDTVKHIVYCVAQRSWILSVAIMKFYIRHILSSHIISYIRIDIRSYLVYRNIPYMLTIYHINLSYFCFIF